MGRPRLYSDEELLTRLRQAATNGVAPSSTLLGLSFLKTLQHRFGSYAQAIVKAGLTPTRRTGSSSRRGMIESPTAAAKLSDVREYWATQDPKAAGLA